MESAQCSLSNIFMNQGHRTIPRCSSATEITLEKVKCSSRGFLCHNASNSPLVQITCCFNGYWQKDVCRWQDESILLLLLF